MLTHFRSISTTYHGPTNFKGARIIARASNDGPSFPGQSVIMSYDHALGTDENHAKAAKLLATKLEWVGNWIMGGHPRGAVFVLAHSRHMPAEGFTVTEV